MYLGRIIRALGNSGGDYMAKNKNKTETLEISQCNQIPNPFQKSDSS